MTDRIRTLSVVLDRDIRTDDLEVVKSAISMIKGVRNVHDGDVVGVEELMSREVALTEFISTLHSFLAIAMRHGDGFKAVKAAVDAHKPY